MGYKDGIASVVRCVLERASLEFSAAILGKYLSIEFILLIGGRTSAGVTVSPSALLVILFHCQQIVFQHASL